MKHLKKFEAKQEIKKKDLQETIDEVLDSLSDKGELSKSEEEFMTAAANDEVQNVTTPQMTGNFWADMANPHNIGIMWQGKDGVWKQLEELPEVETVDFKEKDYKHLNYLSKEDQEWEVKKIKGRKKILKENPGLKEDLEKLAELFRKSDQEETRYIEIFADKLHKKWKKPYDDDNKNYNYNQIIDYAFNGTFHSLINQFGYWGVDDEDENFYIYSE